MAKINNKNAINVGLSDFLDLLLDVKKNIKDFSAETSKLENEYARASKQRKQYILEELALNKLLLESEYKRQSALNSINRLQKNIIEDSKKVITPKEVESIIRDLRMAQSISGDKSIGGSIAKAKSLVATPTEYLASLETNNTLVKDVFRNLHIPEAKNMSSLVDKAVEAGYAGKALTPFFAKGVSMDVISFATKEIGKLFTKIENLAKNFYKEIWNSAKKMLDDVATYSLSSSYITNASARNQALTYGLSDAQNYAFTQVKSLMGISSDEDLYYMNENQRAMFSTLMEKYSSLYEEMNASGQLADYQEVKLTWKELKAEWSATIVKFFSENKDTIIGFMNAGMSFMSFVMNSLSTLVNFFAGTTSGGLDYLSNATAVSSSNVRNNNVVFYNTANANSVSEANNLVNSIAGVNAVQAMNFMES